MIHIKISRPHQAQHCSETLTDQLSGRRTSSIDSNGRKEMREVVREEGPVSSNEAGTVPARTQRHRRRYHPAQHANLLMSRFVNDT